MKTDIQIAQEAVLQPIGEIAAQLGIPTEALEFYGPHKAKVSLKFYQQVQSQPAGKLVLVTAITPTPAGEGKSTTTVGLAQGLAKRGIKVAAALREPSLGPCFGVKGGAAGGGYSQVVPMEDINLHFTGDFHAISAAHNLLAAMLDNHMHQGNLLDIDSRRVILKRVVDMNDRALRKTVIGLGGRLDGIPREDGYDITVASEVMAILCLATSIMDLKERLGRMIIAYNRKGEPVTASQILAHGAMAALLKDAIKPNLVQTLEGVPTFIHGGPFANIAHGCNSVMATQLALRTADVAVTEAGFGADLGAEKFLDIKCRAAGLWPSAVVLVATIRALKMHGGLAKTDLTKPDVTALQKGSVNLAKHVENMKKYGLPVVVAVNIFPTDTPEELAALEEICRELQVPCKLSDVWKKGGEGGLELADTVLELIAEEKSPAFLYPSSMSPADKIKTIAREIYGAKDVVFEKAALSALEQVDKLDLNEFPICMAKTQYSFSDDPTKLGRPEDFILTVKNIRIAAGAGFLVALTGEIMTMPGLPKAPAAEGIDVDEEGRITGLF